MDCKAELEAGGKIEAMAEGAAENRFTGAISAGPLGTLARLLWFLLLCSILFVIGLVKGDFHFAGADLNSEFDSYRSSSDIHNSVLVLPFSDSF